MDAGKYWDLGVTPCGARLGIRKGGKGAVRLPRIRVLIICYLVQEVCVPQGKVGPNPHASIAKGKSTSFGQSEYLVYSETQVRIRYVLKMNFDQSGGHWH